MSKNRTHLFKTYFNRFRCFLSDISGLVIMMALFIGLMSARIAPYISLDSLSFIR